MQDVTTHTADLIGTYQDGSTEWFCPVCGCHFRQWQNRTPHREYQSFGDVAATHSSGGVQMGREIDAENELVQYDAWRLASFERYFQNRNRHDI